jgi:hypothetical protein
MSLITDNHQREEEEEEDTEQQEEEFAPNSARHLIATLFEKPSEVPYGTIEYKINTNKPLDNNTPQNIATTQQSVPQPQPVELMSVFQQVLRNAITDIETAKIETQRLQLEKDVELATLRDKLTKVRNDITVDP